MQEVWKIINDFEDYEISNLGRVKSFKGKDNIIKKELDKEIIIEDNSDMLTKNENKNGDLKND